MIPWENHTVEEVEEEIREKIADHSWDKKIPINYQKVLKKYCFEFEVSKRNEEQPVLKLSYSFKYRRLNWLEPKGKTYQGLFGLSYTALELFFL